jgi:hypothetical protein
MKINIRSVAIIAVSASAVPAFAQFSPIYQSDNGLSKVLTRASQYSGLSYGVGYDPTNTYGAFPASQTASTSQTQFDEIQIGSSVAAGSQLEFAVHALALNEQNPGTPVTIYATLLKGWGFGGTAIATDVAIHVTDAGSVGNFLDTLYTSDAVTTSTGFSAGDYTLVFSGGPAGDNRPANTALVIEDPHTAAFSAFYNHKRLETYNDSDYLGASGSDLGSFTSQAIAARIYAKAPIVPEPAPIAVVAIGCVGLLRRRRKQA